MKNIIGYLIIMRIFFKNLANMTLNSLRAKITLWTACAIVIAMTVATLLSVISIRNIGNSSSNQMLLLLCEAGEKNLDFYFKSVEHSIEMISNYVKSDLGEFEKTDSDLNPEQFSEHLERVKELFGKIIYKTNGILTYYYRIDPAVSKTSKGFWFVNLNDDGFKEHEVTDISQYNTDDTSNLVWFTVPKSTGNSIWLPPYITDNLGIRVISYNMPIYYHDKFIGVVGIEIDYSTMAEQVDNIKLLDNGYAFLNDSEGRIIYHPRMDVTTMEIQPKVPEGLLANDKFVRYRFDGIDKQAVWLTLSNGMRLNVTVPISEINGNWEYLIFNILIVSILLLIVFIFCTMRLSGHITRPLRELTNMAKEVNNGNYDVKLEASGNDEVSILTNTFNQLISHLKVHIKDLNNLAYADALTSLRNKGACDIYIQKLQNQLNDSNGNLKFAIGIFDCNNLKIINDRHGHDKGDIYLKSASTLICRVFKHSPVFRTGGDEFTVVLQNEDYQKRNELINLFEEKSFEISETKKAHWEKVSVAIGIADYDSEIDKSVIDVMRRADYLMYENKRKQKNK